MLCVGYNYDFTAIFDRGRQSNGSRIDVVTTALFERIVVNFTSLVR